MYGLIVGSSSGGGVDVASGENVSTLCLLMVLITNSINLHLHHCLLFKQTFKARSNKSPISLPVTGSSVNCRSSSFLIPTYCLMKQAPCCRTGEGQSVRASQRAEAELAAQIWCSFIKSTQTLTEVKVGVKAVKVVCGLAARSGSKVERLLRCHLR